MPVCGRCLGANKSCKYRAPKRRDADEWLVYYENLLSTFRSVPEESAIQLLRELRLADDSARFVKSYDDRETSLTLLRPSDSSTTLSVHSSASTTTELELMAGHRNAYLDIDRLETTLLESLAYGSHPTLGTDASALAERAGRSVVQPEITELLGSAASGNLARSGRTHKKPCDERLEHIPLSYWTKIPIAGDFAAAALAHYLERDHMIMAFFNADIVLDDLITCRPRFCTPFFVSSLLFVACVSPICCTSVQASLSCNVALRN